MSLFIIQGRGPHASREIWMPGDPGVPTHADTKQELVSFCPPPERLLCNVPECENIRQVWAGVQYRENRQRWYWFKRTTCQRCRFLGDAHGLSLAELIAIWESQNARCHSCFRELVDPRISDHDGRRLTNGQAYSLRIDHDHRICPQKQHSCQRCRRGLVCNYCNTRGLAETSAGLRILPEKDEDLDSWLEFIGPESRDRLLARLR